MNGIGSTHSIERRSSNESDESDNLSQYFRSPSSRKSSLMATNDLITNSHERSHSVSVNDSDLTNDASRRLQSFLRNDGKRLSNDSAGRESITLTKREGRKSSSTLGSFKFIKKKTKSVDLTNQVCRMKKIFFNKLFFVFLLIRSPLMAEIICMLAIFNYKSDIIANVNN